MPTLEELENKIKQLEQQVQLFQRTDPAIALGIDLHSLGQVPAVRVYRSAAQEDIVKDTPTAIIFTHERYDNDQIHSTTTNTSRLTATVAGVYNISGNVKWSANPLDGTIYIKLNGATFIAQHGVLADYRTMSVSTDYNLGAGDYVELFVIQGTAGNLNILATGNISPEFMMHKVAEV